ncbi:MAG: glycosyltransferase family 4 protein [Solirubrobacteraceae bacterium]
MKVVSVMSTQASGGAEFAAIEMLEALRERGHETLMLSDLPRIGRETGVTVRRIDLGPKLSGRNWSEVAPRAPSLLARLWRALAAESPYDVLLLHYKKEQLLARALPARLRASTVWAEWGPVPVQMRSGPARLLYLAAARDVAVVMAVSAGTSRSVREVGVAPSKVVVVPNVLRTDDIAFEPEGRRRVRERLGIPDDAFVVGCISRLHPKKRNDVVIEAVRRLDDPRMHVVLAGDGETAEQLRELARPLAERAHFISTPGADVAEVLSAFDVSVFCPSPAEGEPRAVILGMLASRPCLSTGAEGVADMIVPGLGAIASPENDPAVLEQLLRGYLDDPVRLAREGAAGRAFAERTYAAPIVAAQIERLLETALARRRSGKRAA